MAKMEYEDIDWNSERGLAYQEAKRFPGKVIQFQAETGYAIVYYVKGAPEIEMMAGLIIGGRPGRWFERPVRDLTKITPDANDVGFRVYDKEEGKEE